MDDITMRDAARELAGRIKARLDRGLEPEVRLTRDEAILAQAFAECLADILADKCALGPR